MGPPSFIGKQLKEEWITAEGKVKDILRTEAEQAEYTRLWRQPGKNGQDKANSVLERNIKELRRFIETRPEIAKPHNQFSALFNLWSKQKVKVPTFAELELEPNGRDGHGEHDQTSFELKSSMKKLHDANTSRTDSLLTAHKEPKLAVGGSHALEGTCVENQQVLRVGSRNRLLVEQTNAVRGYKVVEDSLHTSKSMTTQRTTMTTTQSLADFTTTVYNDSATAISEAIRGINTLTDHPLNSGGQAISITGQVAIKNPEAFQHWRIRNLASKWPSTKITSATTHVFNGRITFIVVKVANCAVDDFVFTDGRMFQHLGLGPGGPNYDTIEWKAEFDKYEPSFILNADNEALMTRADGTLGGVLYAGRHCFLHWLEYRKEEFPSSPPTLAECRALADRGGILDPAFIRKEVKEWFDLEHGEDGEWHRNEGRAILDRDGTFFATK